jgi:putative endonuclease
MAADRYYVYLVRCRDGSLYCGVSNDVKCRVFMHNAGTGAKYTYSRRPVVLVATSPPFPSRGEAQSFEYKVKKLPAVEKIAAVQRGTINAERETT